MAVGKRSLCAEKTESELVAEDAGCSKGGCMGWKQGQKDDSGKLSQTRGKEEAAAADQDMMLIGVLQVDEEEGTCSCRPERADEMKAVGDLSRVTLPDGLK